MQTKQTKSLENYTFRQQNLRLLLEQHISKPIVGDDIKIDYDNFVKVGSLAGPKCQQVSFCSPICTFVS